MTVSRLSAVGALLLRRRIRSSLACVPLAAAALAGALITASCGSADDAGTDIGADAAPAQQATADNTATIGSAEDLSTSSGTESDAAGDAAPVASAQADLPAGDWPLTYDGPTVLGAQFEPGDYAGQDLVLWFWAPW